MKEYNSPKHSATRIDRIERAVELINNGAIFEHHKGEWRVFTDRMNIPYTVKDGKCDCYDFTETLKGESPCKHIWAVAGASVAMMIHDLRQAKNQTELDSVVATYREALKSTPAAYVAVARNEYRVKRNALFIAARKRRAEEDNAVLVKPQPNGSRCGSIDV